MRSQPGRSARSSMSLNDTQVIEIKLNGAAILQCIVQHVSCFEVPLNDKQRAPQPAREESTRTALPLSASNSGTLG